jgi:hypothetical protein
MLDTEKALEVNARKLAVGFLIVEDRDMAYRDAPADKVPGESRSGR